MCDVFPKQNEETAYRLEHNAVLKSWREFNLKFQIPNTIFGKIQPFFPTPLGAIKNTSSIKVNYFVQIIKDNTTSPLQHILVLVSFCCPTVV